MSPAPIIVVTGPSGVGKTTVAGRVATAFDHSVHVAGDDFLASVVSGWVDPWLPESAGQNTAVGAAIAHAVLAFAGSGYTVVLDGHFFPAGVEPLARAGAGRDIPLSYAVLRADVDTCLRRVAQRSPQDGDPTPRGRLEERFAALPPPEAEELLRRQHALFTELGAYEANVIDAAGGPDDTAASVLAAVRAGRLAITG